MGGCEKGLIRATLLIPRLVHPERGFFLRAHPIGAAIKKTEIQKQEIQLSYLGQL
jgi:hypothetical protein